MINRIRKLNWYQKVLLIVILAMILIYPFLYHNTIARKGIAFHEVILEESSEGNARVYSGKLYDCPVSFTLNADKSVVFKFNDDVYGPYEYKDDNSIITDKDHPDEKGIEISLNGQTVFRGTVFPINNTDCWLYNADGSQYYNNEVIAEISQSKSGYTEYTTVLMPMDVIAHLMVGMEPVHKGNWMYYGFSVVFCIIVALSILYADEIFRFGLHFTIKDPEKAEPAEWEIISRYVDWTLLVFLIYQLFSAGLNEIQII